MIDERHIVFIGLSEDRIDGNHQVEAMYELSGRQDRWNFRCWFERIREMHFDYILTTTTELDRVPTFMPTECEYRGTYMRHDDVQRLNCRPQITH